MNRDPDHRIQIADPWGGSNLSIYVFTFISSSKTLFLHNSWPSSIDIQWQKDGPSTMNWQSYFSSQTSQHYYPPSFGKNMSPLIYAFSRKVLVITRYVLCFVIIPVPLIRLSLRMNGYQSTRMQPYLVQYIYTEVV